MRAPIYPLPINEFVDCGFPRFIRLPMNEFMGYGDILVSFSLPTNEFVFVPTNEFVGYDDTFIVRPCTNEFVPYFIRHQNTYTPNATHDFNHGISAPNNDPLTTHDFSRGYYGVKNERVVTHEFIRGTMNHNTIYATHSLSRSIGKFIHGFQEAIC
ncbi:MAG: hypothetical protein V1715_14370 [bacterium]